MKTAILITARLKSTRLPMKVTKLVHGRPMIWHMIERLKLAKRPEQIVLCTSIVAQDDPLEQIAAEEGIDCFRGDPDDVLDRLTRAAQLYGIDTVISVTADNPFVDPEYIDRLADFHVTNHHDYSDTEGLPWGTFSYALSRPAMERACAMKAERDTEVWSGYFRDTGAFRWGTMKISDPEVNWPTLRLTVDTPEDFELVTALFDELYQPPEIFPLRDIVALCRQRPELPAINDLVMQKAANPIKLKPAGDTP